MDVHDPFLLRTAGLCAAAAVITLVVSAVTILLFFSGAGEIYGPLNDVFVALTLALLIVPMIVLYGLLAAETGAWFTILSGLAVLGLVVAAGGQLLLVVGAIDLNTSFVTGGLGILPVLAWAGAFVIVALRSPVVPDSLGWLLLLVLGLAAVTAVSSVLLPPAGLVVVSATLLLAMLAWLGALAMDFLARVPAVA